jgi:molybdate transport system regulatory protein
MAGAMARPFLRVYFGDSWIGPGKVQLLEAIGARGSISAAARDIGMSYRRAWVLVDSLNQMFREAAVRTTLGGVRGGAADLTETGAEIVRRYRAMEASTRRAIARDAGVLERRIKPQPRARRS